MELFTLGKNREKVGGSCLPTEFDSVFNRHRGTIPIEFVRALAKNESNFNPKDQSGPAWGILQVTEVVRKDHNQRGGNVSRHDLLDPDTNSKVALGLIQRIVAAYQKHPDKNLREDWSNPEFVKLLVAGWNSGYSEAGGVGKVAKWLHLKGIPVTHDNVFKHAKEARATKFLQLDLFPQKYRWQKKVAQAYFDELACRGKTPPRGPRGLGGSPNIASIAILGLGLGGVLALASLVKE